MKFQNIIILTLTLIFSQNVFSTGSDGGNSQPGAQPPAIPPLNVGPTLCLSNLETGEEICIVIGRNGDEADS